MAGEPTLLKKSHARVTGTCRLGASSTVAPARERPGLAPPPEAQTGPAARIVQQNDTGAIIEVTCACGHTVQLLCQYDPAGSVAADGRA